MFENEQRRPGGGGAAGCHAEDGEQQHRAKPDRDQARGIRITRMRKAAGALLCKKISLGEDGSLVSDARPCAMSRGAATRVGIVTGAAGLAKLIGTLDRSEALVLGDHVAEADEIEIVMAKHADPSRGRYGRTLDTFKFRPGEPAACLLDFDQKAMPDDVAERIEGLGGFEGAIESLLPGLPNCARVIRASTSAGIYNEETGDQFKAGGGKHLYVLAKDGADIPRFLRDLQARAWLAGLGWIMVAGRGALLIRSIVDVTVGSPERLVFEGPPCVVAPLAQDQEARAPVAHDGEMIDTRSACPPLTDAEMQRHQALVDAAKRAAKPEVETSREKAAEKLAADRDIPIASARTMVTASTNGMLLSYDELHFDDEEIGVVSVANILADPARYNGETLADPIEGRCYGRGKARLYFNGGGHVIVNSFAHGGCVYKVLHCPEYIANRVEEAGEKAPNVLAAMMPFAYQLDPVERERLRDLAAKTGGVNKTPVKQLVNAAEIKARAEEREARAKAAPRGDGKPKQARQRLVLVDGERPAIVHKIEKVLRNPANVVDGAVLARGATTVVLRRMAEPFKLKVGSGEIDMPAGAIYLAQSKPEHLQAQIDRHFALIKFNADGEAKPTDCPGDLARYVLANSGLLPVTSIRRAPVLRADGSVIEVPGYDPSTGIVYAPDIAFPPIPTNLTKADAEAALKRLRHPFRGFPFVTEHDRDAIVAEVLTLFVRHLVPVAPAFTHNAVDAGSGKSKLFEVTSIIATGTKPAMLNADVLRDEVELRKHLTTLTLSAAPLAVFDNAQRGETLKSPGLANFITASVYGDRLLGSNEEVKAETCTVVGITGNHIEPAGDLTRRMIVIDLDAKCERPETRDFDFEPTVEADQDRADLVVAALTMLRAHALAGRPSVLARGSFGNFEQWDRLVAGAIVYAGGHDPVKLLEKIRTADPEREGLAEVLGMLEGIGAITGHGKRSGEIVAAVRKRAEANPLDADAADWMALLRRLGKEGQPDPTRLGRFLAKNAGRIVGGMRLTTGNDTHAKVRTYYVEQTANGQPKTAGVADDAGVSSSPYAWKGFFSEGGEKKGFKCNGLAEPPLTTASPATGGPDDPLDGEPWEEIL
jgi:hypothetical protein